MSSDQHNVIISPEPLKSRVETLRTIPGVNLAGVLRCAVSNGGLSYVDLPRVHIRVNGELQEKTEEALDRVLEDGDLVHLSVEIHGDNPLRTAFQLFVQVTALVVGFYFGPWAAAAVQVAGALLTTALFPANRPEQLADANDSGNLRDQSNSIRRRAPMPLILGEQRVGFDVAALAYSQLIGADVWLNVIFGVHFGKCLIEDIKVGETLLADYPASDYQIEIFDTPGPRLSRIYPNTVIQENLNDELNVDTQAYEIHTTPDGFLADRIEVDIAHPAGLVYAKEDKKHPKAMAGLIEYAEVGTELWFPAPIPAMSDKNGVPLPTGTFYTHVKTLDPVRRTWSFEPAQPGQYKVRVKAWDPDNQDPEKATKDTYWTALRAIAYEQPIVDETLSCVALKIKSSGDLSGTLPTVTARVTPIVPIWDPIEENWATEAPTSNFAALARWALTGAPAAQPLDPEEINESCATIYQLIEDRDWHAAVYLTEEASQEDLLRVLGQGGRFSTYWSGEDLCFVGDWEKPIPRQVFSPSNVQAYRYRREFQDEIHAVLVEFKNLEQDSAADELWVYADGRNAANSTLFESLRMNYQCTPNRAYREGRVYLAKRELKSESHEWVAGFDSVTATYGDRVRVSHYATLFGLGSGRVVNRWFNADQTQVIGLRLDFQVDMLPGRDYSIDVRRFDEVIIGLQLDHRPGKSKNVFFEIPMPVADAPLKDDLIVFGETNIVSEDLEIDDFSPQDQHSVRINASPYMAEKIELAETGPIPPLQTILKPKVPAPQVRFISWTGDPSGVEAIFDVTSDPYNPIQGFVGRYRYSAVDPNYDSTWTTLPSLPATARSIKTPPIQRAAFTPGDVEGETRIDLQIMTVMRQGQTSKPSTVFDILITKLVSPPENFDAIGVKRQASDGSAYPALAVICDPLLGGDVQHLEIEVQEIDGVGLWTSAGQPLPASNPVGDQLSVSSGERYNVRGRWRSQDNWPSTWAYVYNVQIPGASSVSSDVVRIGGRLVNQVFGDIDAQAENIIREALDRHEALALVSRRVTTVSDANGTLAQVVDTVLATQDGLVASVEKLDEAFVDGITGEVRAVTGLRLTAGNRVSGYIIQNNGIESSFDIEADFFRVWNGTSSVPAFEVSGGLAYVSGNLVRTGSVVDEAITSFVSAYNGSLQGWSGMGLVPVINVNYTSTGRRVRIQVNYHLIVQDSPGFTFTIELVRARVGLPEVVLQSISVVPPSGEDFIHGWQSVIVPDIAPPDTYMYFLRHGSLGTSLDSFEVRGAYIEVEETRK